MALVAIEHPDLETPATGPALVSEGAFDSVWKNLGWTKIEGSEKETPEQVLPPGSLDTQIRRAQAAMESGQLAPGAQLVASTGGPEPERPARRHRTGQEENA